LYKLPTKLVALIHCLISGASFRTIFLAGLFVLLPITRVQSSNGVTGNYGNYPYGNYAGNAPVGKVITLNT